MTEPYLRFMQSNLILRDELAIDRTLLANERTLLAYFRSGLTLILAGLSFMHFSENARLFLIGQCLLPCGLIVFSLGYFRYFKMNRRIQAVRKMAEKQSVDSKTPSEV